MTQRFSDESPPNSSESDPSAKDTAPGDPAPSDLPPEDPLWVQKLPALVATFLWTVAIGFGLGLLQALIMFPNRRDFSLTNTLPRAFRQAALLNMGQWIVAGLLIVAVYLLFKGRNWQRVDRALDAVRAISPLAWLWPIPLYFDWEVFNASGLERVVIAVFWGLGLERCFRHTFRVAVPFLRARSTWQMVKAATFDRLPRVVPGLVCLTALATLVVWFSTFCASATVMQHHRMGTTAFDLGIFDNLFYNLLQGEFFRGGVDIDNRGGNHLQFHANFLAYVFVPLYALSPRAETLLIMQAWIVGLSAIPIYLLVQHRLKSHLAAFALAFVYLAHEALQGPVFYDFHFLTLAPFFIGWTLYFFEKGYRWALLGAWIATVLLREEQGAILSGAALVYLLAGKRIRIAFIGGVLGVLYLAIVRFSIMPMFTADGQFQQHIGYYKGMLPEGENGFVGVLQTMITNPVFMTDSLLNEGKIEYTLLLTVPFVLLPFRSPRLLLLFIPAALFTLGTRNYPPPVSKGFQYTAYWMPLLVLGAVLKLDEWRTTVDKKHYFPAAVSALFVVGGAMGVNGGALFQQNTFTGGFRRIVFEISEQEQTRYDELRELVALIPPTAKVTATESVVPHLSNRPDANTIRQGLHNPEYMLLRYDEIRSGQQADYLLRGLGPLSTQQYGVLRHTKNFSLWKRGAKTTDNLRVLQKAGHMRQLGPDGRPKKRPKPRKAPPAPSQPQSPPEPPQ